MPNDPLSDMLNAIFTRAAAKIGQHLEEAIDNALSPPRPLPAPRNLRSKSGVGSGRGRGRDQAAKNKAGKGQERPQGAWGGGKQAGAGGRNPTLYDVLQVARGADQETIRAAFASLSRRFHPDTGNDKDEVRYKAITAAWNVLKDQKRRKEYDEMLRRTGI